MVKTITIEGMMCNGCANRVTQALNEIKVTDVIIDLDNKTATLNNVSESITDTLLKDTIEDLGFEVTDIK